MVEKKLYKTQLCVLYRRGHCHRETCCFAHGDSELRRYSSSSFNGRKDYRGSDLREKLGRRGSPPRRYSIDRGARDRQTSHGYSPPRSHAKKRRKQQFDGESEFSESLKASDGTEDQVLDRKVTSSSSKDFDEQLRQLQSEIDMLNEHKHQLQVVTTVVENMLKYAGGEIYLEERVQESESLTSKIQDLEIQLDKEKEECKRVSSKIRKFIKEHNRHSKIQDELKRSQDRLQKLADQLGTEAAKSGINEADTNITIVSDEETFATRAMSPQSEPLRNASPSMKRLRTHMVEARDDSKQGARSEKFSRWDTHVGQVNNSKEFEVEANGNNGYRPLANEDKSRRGKSSLTNFSSVVKMRDPEWGLVLPTTGMAAHAVDEVIEVVELDEKFEVEKSASAKVDKGVAHDIPRLPLPLPPPPPLPRNAYSQYKGKNEDVDVDGLDDETLDVDIV